MKLLAYLLPVIFLLSACASHPKPTPVIHADWQSENRSFSESSEDPLYNVDAQYPEFISQPGIASTQTLNNRIHEFIADNVKTFKEKAPKDSIDMQDFPGPMHHNSIEISYDSRLLKPRGHTIASIRFDIKTMYLGEATSEHRFAVINYDLSQGQDVPLKSLFKPGSNYLNVMAGYCQKQLSLRLAGGMPWEPYDQNLTRAYPENYKIWNPDSRGIEITFQPFQIMPFSSSPEVVRVPYSVLRPMMAEDSAFRDYA